jgi:predicted transglutaminase-like cysteine proteinase
MYRLRNVMIMGFYPALFLILAAGAGSMLLDIALPVGAPSGAGIPFLTIVMALALALGAAIALISLMLSPGFRRGPFWLSLAVAALLLLLAMDLDEWIPLISTVFSGFGDVPLQDGITVLALAAAMLFARKALDASSIRSLRYSLAMLATTAAILAAGNLAAASLHLNSAELSARNQLDNLKEELSALFPGYEEEADELAERIIGEEIAGEDREELIADLQRRIAELEGEAALFERSRERIGELEEANRQLRRALEEAGRGGLCAGASDDRVYGFEAAVRPGLPCVRDFAVTLAAEHPGSFYRDIGRAIPGEAGMHQIIAIHRAISTSWKYVNDPLFDARDYYSPADRSIALGLAGDCDDYAILMASAIEAVGGRARILGGSCAEGGHAWAEVYIGAKADWERMQRIMRADGAGIIKGWISPSGPMDYWLSLDWVMGELSCAGEARILYQSR